MKIALLTPTFSRYSGIDRVVELQALSLSKKNTVVVFTLRGGLKPQGFSVVELGMPKNLFWQRLYRLFFFLQRGKIATTARMLCDFDLVISHFYPMNLIACASKKKYGVRWRYHNHGVAPPGLFDSILQRLYVRFFQMLSNASVRTCDEAVSISTYLANVLKEETGICSIVEYNPINTKRFHKKVNGARVRKQYHLGTSPVCLYVGRLSPHKGIHLLLQSYQLAKKKIPNLKLLIVGDGRYRKELEALVRTLQMGDRVLFTGNVQDVSKPLAAMDIFVLPATWREGFGLSIAEAMTCEKPVIVTNIWALNTLIQDRVNGVLVEPKNVEHLAEAIHYMLSHPEFRKKIGKAGRRTAEERFSLERMVRELESVYEEALYH